MIIIQICVGSSCYLKGAKDVVEMFEKEISANNLENDVVLNGSFCAGKCNRIGVTVSVNDEIHTGITKENFQQFFKDNVLTLLSNGG
ncbi:MAG: (2Fe-2S) ferredoxin domain-containing protein [Christensenellaceae bacterium]